ncbi:MAG: c-type cytochrome [Saprospiraceae bacterium]|nr:c-type cytochrome [Saprospiraceae bacterium]
MRPVFLFLLIPVLFTFSCTTDEVVEKEISFNLPAGFELEELYCPSCHEQGSWVALAEDDRGRMYASDQHGELYRFDIPAPGDTLDSLNVIPLGLDIGHAHGLLWAFNSLYVAVNREDSIGIRGSGVYRLMDTDEDSELDSVKLLLRLEGRGEHGPHSFALGPDGRSLYFVAGNHTDIPSSFSSRLPKNWGADNLFPSYRDARGHAARVDPPGGWIARFDPAGTNWELIAAGFRNPFDIAFNSDGELFTYDSDMEWDLGMPWYRPTRICHVTSGADFGWRTGSGKWPAYYPDNLPAVIGMRQGSPTGVLMGGELNFPAEYRNGLFVLDWSFGTIYFVDLQPVGSTYRGAASEFLSGTPLPLTDAIAGKDGAVYFATGGRKLDSHLYRLTYIGTETEEEAQQTAGDTEAELRALRRSLEKLHGELSPEVAVRIWPHLNHPDRFIRYAARLALEHQDISTWVDSLWNTADPVRKIQGTIALARHPQATAQNRALNLLHTVEWSALDKAEQLDLLRVYALLCIRRGMPSSEQRQILINRLYKHFPSKDREMNREISELLVYLQDEAATAFSLDLLERYAADTIQTDSSLLSEDVTERSEKYGPAIQGMLDSMPPTESIHYAVLLSRTDLGWTHEMRERYFDWFFEALNRKGGMSYKGFLDNIRLAALGKVPADDRVYFRERSGFFSPVQELTDLPQPEGPGKDWTIPEIWDLFNPDSTDYEGKIEKGRVVYQAAMCITCHRMEGEGGIIGPDLTQLHTRFNRRDLLYAIVNPSEEISDQYAFTLFEMKDGTRKHGGILNEQEKTYTLIVNPYDVTYTVSVKKDSILEMSPSPVSPMPPGLLNRLNGKEIADLFAYLLDREEETEH